MDTAEKLPRSESDYSKVHVAKGLSRGPQRLISSDQSRASESLEQAREQLAATLGEFEDTLLSLRGQSPVATGVSGSLLRLLRRVVSREVTAAALEEALGAFFAKLGGSPELERDVRQLYHTAHGQLQRSGSPSASERARMLATMEELIAWYGKRAETLLLMRHELRPHDEEGVFDVQVYPNSRHNGVDGMLVTCRATVSARRRGDVWVKLFVRRDGKLISPAPGWQYWVDDTEAFLSPNQPHTERVEGVLCVSAPIVFSPVVTPRSFEIFDRIRLFIPHGAMGLSAGVQSFDIEVELTSSQGPIRTESVSIECAVPPHANSRLHYPSPQALGMWADDLGSGSSIRDVVIDRASVGQGWRGSSEGIRVRSGIKLVGFRGSAVSVEYRLLQPDGRVVQLRQAGRVLAAPAAEGGEGGDPAEVLSRVTLHPDGAVSNYDAVEVRVPLASLELPPGVHHLVLEMTVLDKRGRIICGVAAPHEIQISEVDDGGGELPAPYTQVLGGSRSCVRIAGVEIRSHARFAQRDHLRVSVGVSADSWEGALYRVDVELSVIGCKQPAAVLAQRVWVAGGDDPLQRVVMNFDYAEILSRLPVDTQREYRFAVTARLRDLDERIVAEHTEQASWSAPVASVTIPEPQQTEGAVVVVDLQAERLADENQAVCAVTLNVSPQFRDGDQAVLYYEVLDLNERPLVADSAKHGLPGSIVRVDLVEVRRLAARVPGSLQIRAHLQFPIESMGSEVQFGRTLRLLLLSAEGVLLQAIHHPIFAGDSEVTRRQEQLLIGHDRDAASDASVPPARKGWWGRILGYLEG